MGKKSAAKTTQINDGAIAPLSEFEAKSMFISYALTMGWQLAIAVLAPLLFGIWLDKKFDSSPSYTITAFFIAIAMGSAVVWRTVKSVNEEMAEPKKGKNKS